MECRRCSKRFRQTSWTSDTEVIDICPPCVVELVHVALRAKPEEQEKTGIVPPKETE